MPDSVDDRYAYTAPVGRFGANAFGLYDMMGNAGEWCSDWYGPKYYANSPPDDPQGPEAGSNRVFRGGGWRIDAICCRSAYRNYGKPEDRYGSVDFRVVLTQ